MGLFSIFRKEEVVYFPGCLTYFKYKKSYNLYKEIFKKLGISFVELDNHICCGLPAFESGYEGEARKLMRKNLDLFREKGIRQIITNSPDAYKSFNIDYPKMLPDWDIEILNIWGIIQNKLENKKKLIKNKSFESVVYHDSCYLGRYSSIYEEPREILKLIGYDLKEMENNRENSFCCGSCGTYPLINPGMANKIAKDRILQAKRIGVKKIVVCSLANYDLLKRNAEEYGIQVVELSEILAKALDLIENDEIEEIDEESRIITDTESNRRLREEIKEEDFLDINR